MSAGTCGICRFSCPLSDPGAAPEIEPAPSREGFWGFLFGGEDVFDRYVRTLPLIRWEERKERFDGQVWCRRYPEVVEKRKSSTCGEFKPLALASPFGGDAS